MGWRIVFLLFVLCSASARVDAVEAVTPSFIVAAPSQELADSIAQQLEAERARIAQFWFNASLPPPAERIYVTVLLRADGVGNGEVNMVERQILGFEGTQLHLAGTEIQIQELIPHEVNHSLTNQYFGSRLPRWLDEGMATMVQCGMVHNEERDRTTLACREKRLIPLDELLSMLDYPEEPARKKLFYAQSYSLIEFLLQRGREQGAGGWNQCADCFTPAQLDCASRAKLIGFAACYNRCRSWKEAVAQYGFADTAELEQAWIDWLMQLPVAV